MLSSESLVKIDREVQKYPADQKQSAVMAALRIAQQEKRWLDSAVIEFVAAYLDMPAMAAYEVASFYNMYDLHAVGDYKLTVCTNLPCALSGGADAGEYLKKKLGIEFNQTTPDGKFTLKEGECMGACGDAPVLLVNNHRMCCRMTESQMDQLIDELSK
ncbi:NADH-quinone oxidoreductase subunit NuoE [Niveibacterium umoris]|uniref:NADH-quinone oxidoreductase subunit E n=1 Tax=Niveibacterium umoris TaxID=1193620 RepID=A0A840BNL4_9RHOO|nr:NADH-quinone oxidoreductase subunit NuoE [Niveibacterium umoris]MBB4012057.1 NADH-quinone oxidoreductase subunit E [Niveibacterium umoris]